MCRERFIRPRWLVYPLILWGVLVCVVPSPALGAPLPSEALDGRSTGDLEKLRQVMEVRVVKERLGQLGLSPQEAEAKLASLASEEIHQLAVQVQEIQAGGNGAELLAVILLAILLFILIMELLGRRVISRP